MLLVRRPDKGLLGGMRAFPTGPWNDAPPGLADAPLATDWQPIDDEVTHVFTHFALRLHVRRGEAADRSAGEIWWPIDRLEQAGLPTVFTMEGGYAVAEVGVNVVNVLEGFSQAA